MNGNTFNFPREAPVVLLNGEMSDGIPQNGVPKSVFLYRGSHFPSEMVNLEWVISNRGSPKWCPRIGVSISSNGDPKNWCSHFFQDGLPKSVFSFLK